VEEAMDEETPVKQKSSRTKKKKKKV